MGSHRLKQQQPMPPGKPPTATKRPDQYPQGTREHITKTQAWCSYCLILVHFDAFKTEGERWWYYPPRSGEAVPLPSQPSQTWDIATVDHVIPLSRGGTHTLDNFTLACRTCNSTKSARMNHEWQHDLARIKAKRPPITGPCLLGLHTECDNPDCQCHCHHQNPDTNQ